MEDIGLLVDHFLQELAEEAGASGAKTIEPAAVRLFLRHDWPGNVRELHNEVTKLGTFTEGSVITELDVLENATFLERVTRGRDEPDTAKPDAEGAATAPPGEAGGSLATLEQAELQQIREALRAAGGNRTKAAQILGIDRSTLYRKLKRYGEPG
jgi:DNA-binding NtrC family response regulator